MIKLSDNILVVCVGNICRSPMAEAILKEALKDKQKSNYNVSSAGLGALVGHKPDKIARQLMLEKGVDISGYQATQLNQELIKKAFLILVMEKGHKEVLESKEPIAKGKVFRLGEWGGFDIADPYRQDRKVFEESMYLIEMGVKEWMEKI